LLDAIFDRVRFIFRLRFGKRREQAIKLLCRGSGGGRRFLWRPGRTIRAVKSSRTRMA